MTDLRFSLPSGLKSRVRDSLARWDHDRVIERLWAGDASLWTGADEARWLGWLRIFDESRRHLDQLLQLSDEIRTEGFRRVLLLGMGGSTLAPEVFARAFGHQQGYPALQILDSTDPAQIGAADDLDSTLMVVASKSGSTLEPNLLERYFFQRVREREGELAGRRFIAITDPGSELERTAARDRFRGVLFGDPTVGGRFSALSSFGMAPAALAGLDIRRLLDGAADLAARCGPEQPVTQNPGVVLGTILGQAAREGRDKPTLIVSPDIAGFGAWLEQLLAESTGKAGQALIPIDGEMVGPPERYGEDRLFIYLRLRSGPDPDQDRSVDALEQAGQPVVRIDMADRYDIGAEFFRWELSTAVAGAIMHLNPFDQPDVEAAKQVTRRLAAEYETTGALPPETPIFRDEGIAVFTDRSNATMLERAAGRRHSLTAWLRAHFARLEPGDYAALLAYVQMSSSHEGALQRMRHGIRDHRRVATTVGFGPRYLHSTGQAHKGGPNTGLFLMITADDAHDLPVPGHRYTFGAIKAAQARADFEVLTARARRALRVHLGPDVSAGLATLERAVADALDS